MDFSQFQVPTASIACMVISVILSIGLPVAACIYWRDKTKASLGSAVLGGLIFVAFALLLERFFHVLVFSQFGEAMNNTVIYALYGGFAAGLFEETGRLIAMKFMRKRSDLIRKESIMYGIGHGGIESILLIGMVYISNIATAISINNGTIEQLFIEGNDEINAAMYSSLSQLSTISPVTHIYGGIERISALALQICLSYIVYRAVRDSKIYLYFVAILIHAFVDAGIVLLSSTEISTAVLEAVLFVAVAILVYFTMKEYKKEQALDNTDMIVG